MPYKRNIYNVDWTKLVRWLTEVRLRTPNQLKWLGVFASTIGDVYNAFKLYRTRKVWELNITTQVCSLEFALNDRYDPQNRGIRLKDATEVAPLVLHRKIENKRIVLNRKPESIHKVLYTKPETAAFAFDGVIEVPVWVNFDYAELESFVKQFIMPFKKFKIKII